MREAVRGHRCYQKDEALPVLKQFCLEVEVVANYNFFFQWTPFFVVKTTFTDRVPAFKASTLLMVRSLLQFNIL